MSFGRDMKDSFAVFKIDATTGNTTFLYNDFEVNGLSMGYNQRAPSAAPDGKTFYQRAAKWMPDDIDFMIFALNSETKEFRETLRPHRDAIGGSGGLSGRATCSCDIFDQRWLWPARTGGGEPQDRRHAGALRNHLRLTT